MTAARIAALRLLRALVPVPLTAALLMATLLPQAHASLVADAARATPGVTMTASNGQVRIGPDDGDGFASLRFGPGSGGHPSTVAIRRSDGAWDGSATRGLRMHVQNAMPWALTVELTLVDRAGGTLSARVGLPPGGPLTLTLPLAPTRPKRWGMSAGPPIPWTRDGGPVAVALETNGRIDPRALVEIRIAVPTEAAEQRLRLGKLFLAPADADDERDAYAGIVDRYGQYRRGRWPGRFDGDDDRAFARDLAEQDAALASALAAAAAASAPAATPRTDPYGGLRADRPLAFEGPPVGQPGFFRTAAVRQPDGRLRRLLLTPDGNPFFSLGVNAVQLANSQTFVEGREFMFEQLPPARFRGRQDSTAALPASAGAQQGRGFGRGETADFYQANLHRRDGDDWPARWVARSRERLRAWGFNTLGSWSDDRVTRPASPGPDHPPAPLAYTWTVHVDGDFARLSDGHDWWAGIADPFDPRFTAALDAALAREAAARRDDPALIGYFVDNELGWGDGAATDPLRRYALATSALAMDAHAPQSHAKRAFVARLKQRHGADIGRLNAAWGSRFADWATLEGPLPPQALPDGRRAAVAADLSDLLATHAERYFQAVAQALKRHDPHHLYLGARFASRTPEALAACARWCDVVSFNLYLPSIAIGFEAQAFHRLGKPALLTEFHVGSNDRGPFWSGVLPVASEAERGPGYRRMLDSVLANPDFVGAHWFQYLDQPVTGRWLDGENGHLGLVGITDAPWPEFVQAVEATHRALLERLRREIGLER